MTALPGTVRRAAASDASALADFAARIFQITFGPDNRPEDLAAHLAESYGVPQQTRELEDPDWITLLIGAGAEIAAFAQVRRHSAPACVTTPKPVELYRFYVDQAWHGRGLAQALMAAVRDAARELGGQSLWLSVWEHNPRAIAFYGKSGFQDVGTAWFFVGPDRQTDRVLVRLLDRSESSQVSPTRL